MINFSKYVAGCILDEDKEYALSYIEELLTTEYTDSELIEVFDGYYESYSELNNEGEKNEK